MADPIPVPPTTTIVAIAGCLVGVTYLESALIEYPSRWLGPSGTLVGLAVLLCAQLLLATLLYRRVRRSQDAYSVFFSRATLLVLAAFVTFTAAILVPQGVTLVSHELHGAASAGAALLGLRA